VPHPVLPECLQGPFAIVSDCLVLPEQDLPKNSLVLRFSSEDCHLRALVQIFDDAKRGFGAFNNLILPSASRRTRTVSSFISATFLTFIPTELGSKVFVRYLTRFFTPSGGLILTNVATGTSFRVWMRSSKTFKAASQMCTMKSVVADSVSKPTKLFKWTKKSLKWINY